MSDWFQLRRTRVSIFVSLTVVAGMILLVTPREEILVLYVVLLALIWGVELNRSVRRCESTLQRASPEIWSWMKNGFLFGAFHNLHPRFVKMMLTNNASLPDEARSQLRACLRSHIEAICVIVWMLIAINVFKSFYV